MGRFTAEGPQLAALDAVAARRGTNRYVIAAGLLLEAHSRDQHDDGAVSALRNAVEDVARRHAAAKASFEEQLALVAVSLQRPDMIDRLHLIEGPVRTACRPRGNDVVVTTRQDVAVASSLVPWHVLDALSEAVDP